VKTLLVLKDQWVSRVQKVFTVLTVPVVFQDSTVKTDLTVLMVDEATKDLTVCQA
jgi:hypothetical protein